MATVRAPKQWSLTKTETITSFESWRQNLVYTLNLDSNFAPFLVSGAQWEKKTRQSPHRGFQDDGETVQEARRRTKEQKVTYLEMFLGQIANYAPIISRNTIVKNWTSVDSIWQSIRLHYGFQSSGAHFLDFANIKFQPDERPEDLYQRIIAFIEDNLLGPDSGITHHGNAVAEEEELTPSLENFAVLTWLKLIHEDLPRLVKQRYGTDLRSRTLASIRPEISQAIDSLLEELHSAEDAKVMRSLASSYQPKLSTAISKPTNKGTVRIPSCPLCKTAGRPSRHFLSKCTFLPAEDRKYLMKARHISGIYDSFEIESECDDYEEGQDTGTGNRESDTHSVQRVEIEQSPYLDVFHGHDTVRLTIDSGATGNMMRTSCAQYLGIKISEGTQSVRQADGTSHLKVVGEVRTVFVYDKHKIYFEGLAVENLDVDVLVGIPCMKNNDIAIRPAKHEIHIGNDHVYTYQPKQLQSTRHSVCRADVLRSPQSTTTVWPGSFVEVDVPKHLPQSGSTFALEPRTDFPPHDQWISPMMITSVNGKLRIPNMSAFPQHLGKNEHFCQIRLTDTVDNMPEFNDHSIASAMPLSTSNSRSPEPYSSAVRVDPDKQLPSDVVSQFHSTLNEFDDVFNPTFSGYNGAVGPFEAVVNMGPVQPPQRKGRLPQYSRGQLQELQDKFDELERMGVFKRPEDVGISVEYLIPSFLVKKPSGGFRLVTAFADVGRYAKPQPSLMPDVDSILRQIAQWPYIITTDLTKAFHQIPLSKNSMKYCGTVTPFKGVRVYTRCAMGMPGSETALEELMCRVLGDLIAKGKVVKLADDLYCGGNTPSELLQNWQELLHALRSCNLNLSASKTVIAPKEISILGWIWSNGTIRASPHRISTLSSCDRPSTVTGLRSFIGAFRILSRVVPDSANLVAPLESEIAGRDSKDQITWTDELIEHFGRARDALKSHKRITLPRESDQLWIVTDGSVKQHGLGATLYIGRDSKMLLGGFFSAKLRSRQMTWLPCEVEALSIAAAVKHYAPYIIQSRNKACVLTDSKPCVQAFEKLCRGEFSASPRVLTFLSTASQFHVSIRHVRGSSILPSDHASRNAPECFESTCQICTFVRQSETAVVRPVSFTDIAEGSVRLPFTSRSAWFQIQSECSDLRRTHAHLRQGTRPSRKLTNVKDVKRYLQVATIDKDGLLVTRSNDPFTTTQVRIIVPRQVLPGLVMSLHLKLDHPTSHQLKTLCRRYFYALDMDRAIDQVNANCHTCLSLQKCPKVATPQTTNDPPEAIGTSFAADVIKRERQLILLLRECVTSYTVCALIPDEQKVTLRDTLLSLCANLIPLDGPFAVIRTDPAPGFAALVNDELLSKHRIAIEIGRHKNRNKNPVAERGVQELEEELLRRDPGCRSVSQLALDLATAGLNSRIRSRGLSSREMLTQRDQFTNKQLPVNDRDLILKQNEMRNDNHPHSIASKAPQSGIAVAPNIRIGDLVYLHSDRNKTVGRNRYLVTAIDGIWCSVRKFVGSQLRQLAYRVRQSDVYRIPCPTEQPQRSRESSDDEEEVNSHARKEYSSTVRSDPMPLPPPPPNIPAVIADPPSDDETEDNSVAPQAEHAETQSLRRSDRVRNKPSYLSDYVLTSVCNVHDV